MNRYNGYSIRSHYFTPNPNGRGCYFETDDPDVIALIESVDNYGVDIHPTETIEELEAMKAKVPYHVELKGPSVEALGIELNELGETEIDSEDTEPIAHQGARGTGTTRKQRKGDVTVKGDK